MNYPRSKGFKLTEIAHYLAEARAARGWSQAQLAERACLKRQQVNYYETGARIPSVANLLRLAEALDVPLQRFLSGADRPGTGVRDIALELRSLGLVDLWVEAPAVPGAFRRPEEVVAIAITGTQPEARVLEGVPAVLAWNRWNPVLLRAFARARGRATLFRLAWLADVALTLERMGGFPGGCRGKEDLATFLTRVKSPLSRRWDDVGRRALEPQRSPVWKRWRINYAADLATFRQRAESLLSLAKLERKVFPGQER